MEVLTLDISKQNDLNPIIYGRVGDGNVQTVKVFVTKNGTPYNLAGAVTTFEGVLFANRAKIFDSSGVKIIDETNGIFEYTFPNPSFGVQGRYETAYFSFVYSKTKRTTTSDFIIEVLPNADIDSEEAKTIITEYNRLVEELKELQKKNIAELQNEIDDTKNKLAELRNQLDDVNGKVQAADAKADEIVKKIDAHDVYIKEEVDKRFLPTHKGEITTQDWNDLKKTGIYWVSEPSGENKPKEADYCHLEVIEGHGITQIYHNAAGKIVTRAFVGSPPSWTDWKEIAFADNVVNLTEPQRIGGTKEFSETPLVNGKEVALKENTYTYKKSGIEEVEAAYRSAFGAETNILLVRKGNKVDAYLRVNVVDVEKLKPNMVRIFIIPKGFMVDQEMRAGYWNTALTTVQYIYPQGNYGALYEEGVKGIRFCSDRKGNHYVCGSWYTADALPET